jgi:hypothetical protein
MGRRAWRGAEAEAGTTSTVRGDICGNSAAGAFGACGSKSSDACEVRPRQQAWAAEIASTAGAAAEVPADDIDISACMVQWQEPPAMAASGHATAAKTGAAPKRSTMTSAASWKKRFTVCLAYYESSPPHP